MSPPVQLLEARREEQRICDPDTSSMHAEVQPRTERQGMTEGLMKSTSLSECLAREVAAWSSKHCDQLRNELTSALSYQGEQLGQRYSVEVQLLEDTGEYVHVSVDIEDGSLLRSVLPLTRSFLVYRDGRVDA